ncbi:enoyl-CoA hydratase [Rhodococcus sp. ACS1]|uniref:2-(1,2-epoxy-1,2-dihydrophenyl)acetyl-CoA isomerase n=1 Tax=Rhodococcus koreensis TaxID=99653 RepID=A0A1H4NM05_9NOCA|nr:MULTISPECIES: enoyl-CoA hydratase-related protein [Rhodococcus]PBC52618.1 enoyl-CoA hydratase [Rhodococcus sp. ACS1]QSE84045.1 enoyl-CoA hydratase/isomerase family protein [Rhodococcus koreensis]SEB96296.1 2-(1,2-epoxy-1,2-dihydrophenyl)acetyl-CoA isomerase [Rhodococcus koreensis]
MTSLDGFSKVQLEDGVLRVTIATAENGTSLDGEGLVQGARALEAVGDRIGSVLLVGEGPNFCAGGNVRAFASAPVRSECVAEVAGVFHDFVRALDAVTVPVIAGVHGWAAGAGMSLVCLTDVAIGGPGTKLRPAYPSIGYTPDGGMSWTLPRIVGDARAREILITDAVLSGDEAVRLGILSRLVGDDVVQDEALRLARTLAAGPTSSYSGIKTLVRDSRSRTLAEQLDAEAESIAAAADSPVGREGVDAFVEKRRADFASVK